MKKVIVSIVASAAMTFATLGQAPQAFKYQAVVRDASNTILTDQAVGFQLIIQEGSIGGTAVYTETFTPTSNSYGIINIEIGTGTTVDDFSAIYWANNSYFLETSIDVSGGSSYVVMGASQFMSVPYALHAKTADYAITDNVDDADADPTNEIELPASGTTNDVLTWDGSAWVAQAGASDADWTIDGSGNMSNANIGEVSIGVDATVNGLTVGRGGGNIGSNTANGYQALYSNTTGYNNIANGYDALHFNTTGYNNTANGTSALYFNATGNKNTANGVSALYLNESGNSNTANGQQTLYKNTEGSYNTANGSRALYWNTTGFYNTANGIQALYSNTTGTDNTANGSDALFFNTIGNGNTANGAIALFSNTEGNNNTASGYWALRNTTGSNNIALGYKAGLNLSTGNSNIMIGYNISVPSATGDGQLNIGNLIYGTGIDGTGSTVSSGNIGIGTTTPNEKLDVEGNIEIDGDYNYESSKTYYKSFSGDGFTQVLDGRLRPGNVGTSKYYYFTGGSGLEYASQRIDLPEGAIITNLEGWVYDNDSSALVRVRICRQQNGPEGPVSNTNTQAIATVSTTTTGAAHTVQLLSNAISFWGLVDNQNWAYFVWIEGYADNTDIRFYGARVTYTVSKAE